VRYAGRGPRLALLLITAAAPAAAQEEQFFEPPANKPRVTFQWDLLARYDDTYHLHRPPPLYNEVERARFEVRPELGLDISDRFRVAVRAVGDLGTDHNQDNAVNFDNYRSRGASIERYYVEARPGDFTIDAGAFGMPLVASEMLWDRDIQTPGAAVSWQRDLGGSTLTLAAAGFYGPQREGDHTHIGVGQAVWRVGDPLRLSVDLSAAYWHFDPDDLKPSYIRQNAFVVSGGVRQYASHFRLVDGMIRLRFPVGPVPATVSLDFVENTGSTVANDPGRFAFEGNLILGRVGRPRNVRFTYTFQYVERDAVIGAYNTDDWWFHSWYRGHRVALAYTILPDLYLQGSIVFQQRLDSKSTLNRLMVDLAKLF
jgi:hypothetical protein